MNNPFFPLLPLPVELRQIPIIHDPACYICADPDYARYGLPLCFPCPCCGSHVAADDGDCINCGWKAGSTPESDEDD